jgi:hypothetical protein
VHIFSLRKPEHYFQKNKAKILGGRNTKSISGLWGMAGSDKDV